MKILIAAGGQGTKIWPFSRKSKPKQFQRIIGDESLFTHNVNMLLTKYSPQDIYVSTKRMYIDLVREQAPSLPEENLIFEPDLPQGRGPGEGFAFLKLSLLAPNEPFTILQADCMYLPSAEYLATLDVMENLVRIDRKLISGGLVPEYPVLGVDYFILGDEVVSEGSVKIFAVKEFLGRKTDLADTEKMISENNAVIHTNLNTWFPELMLEAYKKFHPNWYTGLMKIKEVLGTDNETAKIEDIYATMEKGSTELVTKHVFADAYIVQYPFKWVDMGTWDSVYTYLSENGKVHAEGNVVALDSKGTLVKSANKDKLVAVLGLEDMIVVDTEDILFIAPREKVGNMQDVHNEIKNKGMEEYL